MPPISPVLPDTIVPFPISSPFVALVESGLPYDVLIDGVPFLLFPSGDDPYVRDFEENRKEQFDNSIEAGEQTLTDWWLRSQASFHGGAGQNFLDADVRQADVSRIRFDESEYAFPFEPGQVTIAGSFETVSVNYKRLDIVTWAGIKRLAQMSGADNTVVFSTLPGLTGPTTVTLGATGICQDMCTDGENTYVAVADSIYRINSAGTAVQIATVAFTGPIAIGFVKQRLVLANGNKLYVVDPQPGAPPVALSVTYTNPTPGWQYTSIAEGPNGIYLSGYAGSTSQVEAITVTSAGATVTLNAPVVQFSTPRDEIIRKISFYVNNFFVLCTSNGVRVGTFTPYGQPQYGGLIMEGESCYSSAQASGTLVIIGGTNSIWWVDLATQIDSSPRWASARWADDLTGDAANTVVDVASYRLGEHELTYAVMGGSTTLLRQTEYTATEPATLRTSWSRFGTVEPKKLFYLTVRGTFPANLGINPLVVTVETLAGDTQSFTVPGGEDVYEFAVDLPEAEAYRVTFTIQDVGSGNGVQLRSYQMRALPTGFRFGSLVLPLACFNYEQDNAGREIGYDGFALDRLTIVEEAARNNQSITIVDRMTHTSYQTVIRRMQFRQIDRPQPIGRLGGMLTVVLRQV